VSGGVAVTLLSVAAAAPKFTLLGDQPHSGEEDPLGFRELAESLAQLIVASRRSTPFTLGIEAGWGMGKSTLMARLREHLERDRETANVKTVEFNAWTADETGVLEGLVKTVLNEMDANVLRRALRKKQLMSWARVVVSVAADWLKISSVVDQVWDRVAVDPRARNELRDLVEQAVADWRSKQEGAPDDALLCVFVDDLDRCTPEGVLEVFEAMKLYMNVPGFVFVVGYDRDIVSDLVHQTKSYSEAIKAQDYLEKIIQISYRIPRSAPEQSDALLRACLKGSTTDAQFGDAERALVVERNARNPRRIKRFVNGFALTYGLDPQWQKFTAESLIRVQLIYMYFKPFYDLLDRASERDPAAEFTEYIRARDILRRREGNWADVQAAFQRHGLPAPGEQAPDNHGALLELLEAHVDESFVELAAQDGFASLVESLVSATEWPALLQRLAAGQPPLVPGDSADAAAADQVEVIPEGVLAGLSILWVDDQPENNRRYAQQMEYAGATVLTASNSEDALTVLDRSGVDILISDIARPDRPEGGFEDLSAWRDADLAPDAVFFFISRVTRARREAAALLGAEVMSDARVLLLRVGLAAEVKDPTAREVLAALLDSKWEFRTAEGIAKQSGVPEEKVRSVLDAYPQFVRQSSVPDRSGAPLFAAHSALRSRVPTSA
jgi:CheY-like chemotaxis protein